MRFLFISTFLTLSLVCQAQKTQTEVTRSVSTEADRKANDPNVPDVIVQNGQFEKIVLLRFKHNVDLLEAMEAAVEEHQIKDAVILAGIGSVRGYHHHMVSNRDFPSKNYFIKDPNQPADICGMNGYIIDGRVHAHITFSDDEKAFGGHLEPGTPVFTFAIITVGIFSDDVDLTRADDKTLR